MVEFNDLIVFARKFPDVGESTSYGTPALKLKNKLLVRLREDNATIAMVASGQDIEALPQISPDIFSVPPHYAGYGMLVIDLRKVQKQELENLFQDAIKLVGNSLAKKKTKKTNPVETRPAFAKNLSKTPKT